MPPRPTSPREERSEWPRYVERDGTVFRVWEDGAEAELNPAAQALYWRSAVAHRQEDKIAQLQAELDRLRVAGEDALEHIIGDEAAEPRTLAEALLVIDLMQDTAKRALKSYREAVTE